MPNLVELAPNKAALTPHEYLVDCVRERSFQPINANPLDERHRIVTMAVENDWVLNRHLEVWSQLLIETRKQLYVDDFTHHVLGQKLLRLNRMLFPWMKTQLDIDRNDKESALDNFRTIGAKVVITNPFKNPKGDLLPVKGRNHLKGDQIFKTGREVFYFGGYNNIASEVDEADLMVKFIGESARNLSIEYDAILNGDRPEGYKKELEDQTWLLYDAGIPGQSNIMAEALSLARSYSPIRGLSYFYPDGEYLRVLSELHKSGRDIEIITHNPRLKFPIPLTFNFLIWNKNIKTLLWDMWFKGQRIPMLDYPDGVHGKLLIAGNAALFGTHNLSTKGVKAGTQEAAILTTDPELVHNLQAKYQQFASRIRTI